MDMEQRFIRRLGSFLEELAPWLDTSDEDEPLDLEQDEWEQMEEFFSEAYDIEYSHEESLSINDLIEFYMIEARRRS